MDKLSEIRNNIDKLLNKKGFSLNDASIKIGQNSTYLFQFINRGSPKRLKEETR